MDVNVDEFARIIRGYNGTQWMIREDFSKCKFSGDAKILVLGVGGSTLRLSLLTVNSTQPPKFENFLSLQIPIEAKQGNLFEWCVLQCQPSLADHLNTRLCISWSFPINNGKIVIMGKNFSGKYVGIDILECFNEYLLPTHRAEFVTHDGTSLLVSGLNLHNCQLALTLGSGININVLGKDGELINTEISQLGTEWSGISLATEEYDIVSKAAEIQPLEVKAGGMYLGQVVSNYLGYDVSTEEAFDLPLEGKQREVVNFILTRAANLAASCLYAVALAFTAPENVVNVVYTGGLISNLKFKHLLLDECSKLASVHSFTLNFVECPNGSEIGAGIAALANSVV